MTNVSEKIDQSKSKADFLAQYPSWSGVILVRIGIYKTFSNEKHKYEQYK